MRNLLIALSISFLISSSVQADFTVFDIGILFNNAIDSSGNQLVVSEGFENNNLNPDSSVNLPIETFQAGVPLLNPTSGFGFPDGLSNDSFVINLLGSTVGLQWNISNVGLFGDPDNSFMAFGEPIEFTMVDTDVTAFGLSLGSFLGDNEFEITVFDGNGNVALASAFENIGQFFGVVADGGDTISRIEINPLSLALFDDATVWSKTTPIPEPTSFVLLFPACAVLLLRQRKR